jgi:hypothetical protein
MVVTADERLLVSFLEAALEKDGGRPNIVK